MNSADGINGKERHFKQKTRTMFPGRVRLLPQTEIIMIGGSRRVLVGQS